MATIVTAMLAAILYGAGAAIEQRQAARAPRGLAGRPRLLVMLARQPLWLLGLAAQFGGFVLHAVALKLGSLAIVQMLTTTALIVSVILVRVWSGQKMSQGTWVAALTVMVGVAAFLALTTPPAHGHVHDHGNDAIRQALAASVVLGVVTMAVFAAGLRASGPRRALLLSLAAGLLDTAMAVVTLAFARVASHGPVAAATSWTTYAVIVCGLGSLLLTQTAYQAGHPLITLPVISALSPVTSVAIGWGILGETHRLDNISMAGAALTVVITSIALAFLARSAPAGGGPAPVAGGGRAR
jgi:drug/metabolite transporter (DMT)-like permease